MSKKPLEQLTVEEFSKYVKTPFRVHVDSNRVVELVLSSVTPYTPPSPAHETFSLLFVGPADQPLGQKMFDFSHEELGRFHLFIVPVARKGQQLEYEVIFNRKKPSPENQL